ncbi:MAG: hypothetical protein KAR20_16530 [Candidatus Heimdallarchaeota archaeon]|nr:hypothetical protein [Candidatus Heimdallarchaeota archaeon]
MNTKIKCPYCKHEFEYEPEDVGQDETLHIECESCDKEFVGYGSYEFSILGIGKADCLNDGEHLLKESIGVPKGYPKRYRCQLCDVGGPIERFEKHSMQNG